MTATTLTRTTFTVSRALTFFGKAELTRQIGHPPADWPLALVKELIDNALDACENAGVPPEIDIIVATDSFTVRDNGPGLPEATLLAALDFTVTVSDKALYASPSRGQQGNALKTVIAAPFAASGGEHGRVIVEAGRVRHDINVRVDRIKGEPDITVTQEPSSVKTGTSVAVCWPGSPCYLDLRERPDSYHGDVRTLVNAVATFNPHAAFTLTFADGEREEWPASDPAWKKWRPRDPTSPHWYTPETLRDQIAAHVRDGDGARPVRDFVGTFAGLSGSAKRKAVLADAGLTGTTLADLVRGEDDDRRRVAALLGAMQRASTPVPPAKLGVLGREHLVAVLEERYAAEVGSIQYRKVVGTAGDTPFVLEAAFGVNIEQYDSWPLDTFVGLNFTTTFENPIRELDDLLNAARVQYDDPVSLVVHLATPTPAYYDPGKTMLNLPPAIAAALKTMIPVLTKQWTRAKRQADRQDRVQERDLAALRTGHRRHHLSIKDAANVVMEEAYRHASSNGTLPANARQIMYAARPLVQQLTGGKLWKEDSYFTQHLLPDYLDNHPDTTADWDIVFDARGHLTEPHTGRQLGLGTLEVRQYIAGWSTGNVETVPLVVPHHSATRGPHNRYRFALFIEKEGFMPLLERAGIASRYDLAILSSKGMSTTACRHLVEALSARGVTILVVHDCDRSGFSIAHTLGNNTRRYRFESTPNVIDLGLRLEDVTQMDLPSEPVTYPAGVHPGYRLRESGATEAEVGFLVQSRAGGGYVGRRVELNAMTSRQFIGWLEAKLIAQGVTKVVPDDETLVAAYREACRRVTVQAAIEAAEATFNDCDIDVPVALAEQVRDATDDTDLPWDEAVWRIARVHTNTNEGGE